MISTNPHWLLNQFYGHNRKSVVSIISVLDTKMVDIVYGKLGHMCKECHTKLVIVSQWTFDSVVAPVLFIMDKN